jgi:UDP-N-acetylglucosamine 4,6-dehydratase
MITGNIFVTGGSGTLGKALMKRAAAEQWDCRFTVYSRSEFLQAECRNLYPKARYILGDVRDYDRLSTAMAGHDLIIHAAAMKRIPECEANPSECLQINGVGSYNVARAAIQHNVSKCIGISTDKASASVTTYGASKRILEGLFLNAPNSPTDFYVVRYGNVVGSRGSVIPIWRKQYAEGKPLSLTARDMTRFWMAPSDAVDLILKSLQAQPRSILIPRMGALSLEDMARIVVGGMPQFQEIGLRSTEKLHEDLIVAQEEAATFDEGHYVIRQGLKGGISYNSRNAPRLSVAEFQSMLAEVEHDNS